MTGSSGSPKVEIVSVSPRRRWTTADKLRMIQESMEPGKSVSQVARENGVNPNQLFKWRKCMCDAGQIAVSSNDAVVSLSEYKALQKQVRDLERALGRSTMQNQILKEALDIAREKKLISDMHWSQSMDALRNV